MQPYTGTLPRWIITCLFFCSLSFFWSCQKELHYDVDPGTTNGGGGTGGSTAVFSLVPSGSNCSDATASGVFQAGTVLTTSSYITVTVNVTAKGTWVFATSLVNGFGFAGGGNFTSTGSQSIRLLATGTPVAAGNSAFNLNIGTNTCNITIPVVAAGGTGTADFYYKATIGGVDYVQTVTDTNGFIAGSGIGGSDDVSFGAGINFDNPPRPAGTTEMGVDKGILQHYLNCTDAYFKAFFTPGTYPYAPAGFSEFSGGNGVVIFWSDPSGEDWTSQTSTSDQTGSTFTIVSATEFRDITGTLYLKVKMQFSCKLYNVNTGAVKQLTNGEMVSYFGKI